MTIQILDSTNALNSTTAGALNQSEGGVYQRSKTVPPSHTSALSLSEGRVSLRPAGLSKLERRARKEAEQAVKDRKVFTILGPYHSLRAALRRRGWVERFMNAPSPSEIATSIKQRKPGDEPQDKEEETGTVDNDKWFLY